MTMTTRNILLVFVCVFFVFVGATLCLEPTAYVSKLFEIIPYPPKTLSILPPENLPLTENAKASLHVGEWFYFVTKSDDQYAVLRAQKDKVEAVTDVKFKKFCGFLGHLTDGSTLFTHASQTDGERCDLAKFVLDGASPSFSPINTDGATIVTVRPQLYQSKLILILSKENEVYYGQVDQSTFEQKKVADASKASFPLTVRGGQQVNQKLDDSLDNDELYLKASSDKDFWIVSVKNQNMTKVTERNSSTICQDLNSCFLFVHNQQLLLSNGMAISKDNIESIDDDEKLISVWYQNFFCIYGDKQKKLIATNGRSNETKSITTGKILLMIPLPDALIIQSEKGHPLVKIVNPRELKTENIDIGKTDDCVVKYGYQNNLVLGCDHPNGQKFIKRYNLLSKTKIILVKDRQEEKMEKLEAIVTLSETSSPLDTLTFVQMADKKYSLYHMVIGEIAECDNQRNCSSHGICQEDGTCTCFEDKNLGYWKGMSCDQCKTAGFVPDTNCTVCKDGFSEDDCSAFSCFERRVNDSNVCSGRGQCVDVNTCHCRKRYTGDNCESTTCYGQNNNEGAACSGRGLCIDFNYCKCPEGYTGLECEIWEQGDYLWVLIIIMCFGTGFLVLFLLAAVTYVYRRGSGYHGPNQLRLDDIDDSLVIRSRGNQSENFVQLTDENEDDVELEGLDEVENRR